jgi:hypothetical protein
MEFGQEEAGKADWSCTRKWPKTGSATWTVHKLQGPKTQRFEDKSLEGVEPFGSYIIEIKSDKLSKKRKLKMV